MTRAQAVTVEMSSLPPSVNTIWKRFGRNVCRSDAYKAWLQSAGWELATREPRGSSVKGPYALELRFRRDASAAARLDLGNLEKAVSDLLVAHGVIQDDSLAQSISMAWSSDGPAVWARVVATREAA